jgi:ABC-type bacteriocin/lantibiotic exporter with double-glycine peptidase domain
VQGRQSILGCALAACALAGCYRGTAVDAPAEAVARDPNWIRVDLPPVRQTGASDCGAAALASVLGYWGRPASLPTIERSVDVKHGGASLGQLESFARAQGLAAYAFNAQLSDLEHELRAGRPVIVGMVKPYRPGRGIAHYEVVTGYEPVQQRILTFDPARGLRENALSGFLAEWQPTKRVALVVLQGE